MNGRPDRADRREEGTRDAIASTARTLRESAAKSGHPMSTAESEERVRKARLREEARNPRS